MTRWTARWTTALAAAALLALPATGLAQGTTEQPPATQAQPPTQAPPAPAGAQPDQDTAKQHLTAARNTLSEMTQLPAASQLTGDARAQVSQLITNFNELITTTAEWRASYSKVAANLNALIGTATTDEAAARTTGTEGAVGTSGTVTVDPTIKAKLVEFRNHLDKFEKAAGGAKTPEAPAATPDTAAAAAAATATATAPPTPAAQGATMQHPQMDHQEVLRHIQAIEAILNVQGGATAGTTGSTTETAPAATQSGLTLSPAQVDQLRTHLGELKRLLNPR